MALRKQRRKYRIYRRFVRDDRYEFAAVVTAVSGKQAKNILRYKLYASSEDNGLSFDDILQKEGIEFLAARYGSAWDVELFNRSRPGKPPIKHYKRPELPVQILLPGMGRNAQVLWILSASLSPRERRAFLLSFLW